MSWKGMCVATHILAHIGKSGMCVNHIPMGTHITHMGIEPLEGGMTPPNELAGGWRMAGRTIESACALCPSLRTAADLLTARLDAGSVRTSVYVALDAAGMPLYVGITGAGLVRFDQHASENAHWWLQADRLIVRHFHCRHVALDVEAYLICALDPEWNVDRPLRNQECGHVQALAAHFDEELSIT